MMRAITSHFQDLWSGRPCSISLARRGFWVSMFVLHLFLFRRVWPTGDAAGFAGVDVFAVALRLSALSLSSIFFLCKALDVAWLRLKPGRRSRIAALIAVALVHYGSIERTSATGANLAPGALAIFVAAGIVAETEVLRSLYQKVLHICSTIFGKKQSELSLAGYLTAILRSFTQQVILRAALFPRAPPIS